MTAEARILRRLRQAPDLMAEMEKLEAEIRAKVKRETDRIARVNAPGKSRQQRKDEEVEFYRQARADARARATVPTDPTLGPRCEHVSSDGHRCSFAGIDPDHVLGGAMRKECERLGAEGLMCLCRQHHNLKHANCPTRGSWLDQAEGFALRHGYKRLLSLIARSRAKHEGKRLARAAGGTRG